MFGLFRRKPDAKVMAELTTALAFAVGKGFSATTDGSSDRAAVLAERARGNARAVLQNHGPLDRATERALWALIEQQIAEETKQATP